MKNLEEVLLAVLDGTSNSTVSKAKHLEAASRIALFMEENVVVPSRVEREIEPK